MHYTVTIHGRIWSRRSDHPYIVYGSDLLKSVHYVWMIRASGAYSYCNSVRISYVILEGPLECYQIACAIRTLYMQGASDAIRTLFIEE